MPNSFLTSEGSVPDLRRYQSTDEKIEVLQNYLYQLLEELRYTLHNINADDIDTESWNRRMEEVTETSSKISEIRQTIDSIRSTLSENTDTIEGHTTKFSQIDQTISGIIATIEEGIEIDGTNYVTKSELGLQPGVIYSNVLSDYQTTTAAGSESQRLESLITQTANSIISTVAETYQTKTDASSTEQDLRSTITQTASGITSQVSQTYELKTDAESKLTEAKSYADTQITQSASAITLSVSNTYETKSDASGKLTESKNYTDSKIQISETGILSTVANTYQTQDAAATMQSSIEQNAGNITLTTQRLDNLKIGSTNLFRGSNSYELASSYSVDETYGKGRWYKITWSGGNATVETFSMTDPPASGITNGVSLLTNTTGSTFLLQTFNPSSIVFTSEKTYVFSGYRRVNPNSTEDTVTSRIYLSGLRSGSNTVLFQWEDEISKSDGWEQFSETFTVDWDVSRVSYFYMGITGAGSIDYCGLKLEEGNIPTSWEMNEYDIRELATAQLKVDVSSITSQVSTLSGNVSQLQQTATGLTSQVTSLNNKKVGGRNYILNTDNLYNWTKSSGVTLDTNNGVITYPTKTANAWLEARARNFVEYKYLRNKETIFSCEWYAETGVEVKLYITYFLNNSGDTGRRVYKGWTKTLTGTGQWEKVSFDPVTVTDSLFTSGSGLNSFDDAYFGVQIYSHNTCWNTFQVRRPKCEIGNVATDWDPAPEDYFSRIKQTADNIESKVSAGDVVSVINQSAEKISASAVDIDLSGFVTFTNLTDTTRTIIHGNVIKSGTILADRLSVQSLSAISANLGTITAGTINGGTINADKVTINNLKAEQIASGTLNSNVIYSNTIQASQIQSDSLAAINANLGAITAGTIDATYVTIKNLKANSITSGTLNCNNITVSNLSASSITSGTLNCSKVTVSNLSASTITAGTMSANRISGGTIDATNVTVKNLNASNITSGTLSANRIAGSSIGADKLKLYGSMAVYSKSSTETVGGYIGYVSGSNGTKTTDGMGFIASSTSLVVTSSGISFNPAGTNVGYCTSSLWNIAKDIRPSAKATSGSGTLNIGGGTYYWKGVYTDHIYVKGTEYHGSDSRIKNNIEYNVPNIIDKLKPCTFLMNHEDDGKVHYGLIAQDVQQIMQDEGIYLYTLLGKDPETKIYQLDYSQIIPLLIDKCQRLQAQIDELEEKVS